MFKKDKSDDYDGGDDGDDQKGIIVDRIPVPVQMIKNGVGNPFNDPGHINMTIPNLIESSRIRRAFYEAYHEALINLQYREENDPVNRTKYIHGAAVIKGNRIIGLGCNDYSRTYVQGKFYLSLHAELSAMINASLPNVNHSPGKSHKNNHKNFRKRTSKNNTTGFELLVIRINAFGHLRSSRPCVNCIEDMKRRQIRKVFYTDDQNNVISEVISEMVPSPDTRPFVLKSHIS